MNVVSEYNKTEYQNILKEFLASKQKLTHSNSFIYEGSKIIAKDEGSFLRVTEKSSYFDIGDYYAFDLFVIVRHNGNEKNAYIHLYHERDYRNGKTKPYIRVGTDYFKKIDKVDRYGIESVKLKKWTRQELKGDYGNDFKMVVDVFDDFIIEPDNINWKPSVGNLYNLYDPFPHKPYNGIVDEKKHLKWTMVLMNHIFGEQWGTQKKPLAGIKYMKILYEDPKQPLPILSLVSNDRSTGKSTFIHYLMQLFNANMNIITPEVISSQFNGSYALKNIIAIEETKFESRQALEKLKSISTQHQIDVNEKFISNYTVPFFGKLIMASNDETKFVQIDDKEIRYWVRRIPAIKIENLSILKDLVVEIPYFLRWLLDVPKFKYEGRQAIPLRETETDILNSVKSESKTWLYKELHDRFEEWFYNNSDVKELYVTPLDVKDMWYSRDSRTNTSFIRNVLKNEFEFKPVDKTVRYTPINVPSTDPYTKKTGKPLIVYRSMFIDSEEEGNETETETELPF